MARYTVIESIPVSTTKALIDALQKLVDPKQPRTYVIDQNDEYISHVELIESTLSDGSTRQTTCQPTR
jgi:hypothetical protein